MQKSFAPLLLSVFLLVTGNGVLSTLIPLRARLEGFSDITIAFMGSSYFTGMLIGSLVVPWVVLRIGQVRAFIICVLMGAAAILSLPSLIEPWSWVLLRGAIGSLAGLYAIAESWFNGKSDNAHRGSALGIYSVVQYLRLVGRQPGFRLAESGRAHLVLVAAAIVAGATLPLSWRPVSHRNGRRGRPCVSAGSSRCLPVGFAGALLIGASNGPFSSYVANLRRRHRSRCTEVGTLMTCFMLGSAARKIPIGRAFSNGSDRAPSWSAFALPRLFSR